MDGRRRFYVGRVLALNNPPAWRRERGCGQRHFHGNRELCGVIRGVFRGARGGEHAGYHPPQPRGRQLRFSRRALAVAERGGEHVAAAGDGNRRRNRNLGPDR